MRTYYPKYLEPDVYRRVLLVAEAYLSDKRKIRDIECNVLYESPAYAGTSGGISKPVQSKVEKIEKHTTLLRGRIDMVERALNRFPAPERRFITQNVCEKIPIIYCDSTRCERGLQIIRHDFLVVLAIEMGEIF